MELTRNLITKPNILGYISEEIVDLGVFQSVDGIYGFGIEGIVISSAVSLIMKKPVITRDLLEKKIKDLNEKLSIVLIVFSTDKLNEIIEEIKNIRYKGIKIDTLVSVSGINENVQKELRLFGVHGISIENKIKEEIIS